MVEVFDEDLLLRRIPIDPNYIKDDNRITSLAFKPRSGDNGLSVNILRFTTLANSIQDKTRFRLASIETEYVRSIDFEVNHDPVADNYAHALITGDFSKGNCRKLASHAIEVHV